MLRLHLFPFVQDFCPLVCLLCPCVSRSARQHTGAWHVRALGGPRYRVILMTVPLPSAFQCRNEATSEEAGVVEVIAEAAAAVAAAAVAIESVEVARPMEQIGKRKTFWI